jgi:peptidoglycan L-alanyl-D-glutamate endopeptidase CwlK
MHRWGDRLIYSWGDRSKRHREELDATLAVLFDRALAASPFDLSITQSHRTKSEHEALPKGATQVEWENSKHSAFPSMAGHLDPYPIDYDDWLRYYVLAGVVMSVAKDLKVDDKIRWGGDWDGDLKLSEETFRDLAHWEIIDG